MVTFEVIVGNIGTVYSGNNYMCAVTKFNGYKKDSIKGYGRSAGESVTLLRNNEVKFEHIGTVDLQQDA